MSLYLGEQKIPGVKFGGLESGSSVLFTKQDLNSLQKKQARENISVIGDESYVTPEMYGAVGDGVADDAPALRKVITDKSVKNIVFFNNYKINSTIEISDHPVNLIILGSIVSYSDIGFKIKTNVNFLGDGILKNENPVGTMLFYEILQGVRIQDCHVTVNVIGVSQAPSESDISCGIRVHLNCPVKEEAEVGFLYNVEFGGTIKFFRYGIYVDASPENKGGWCTTLKISAFIGPCLTGVFFLEHYGHGSIFTGAYQPWYGEKKINSPFIDVDGYCCFYGFYWDSGDGVNDAYLNLRGLGNFAIMHTSIEYVKINPKYKNYNYVISAITSAGIDQFKNLIERNRSNYENWPSNDLENAFYNQDVTASIQKNSSISKIVDSTECMTSDLNTYTQFHSKDKNGRIVVRFEFKTPRYFNGVWARFSRVPGKVTFKVFKKDKEDLESICFVEKTFVKGVDYEQINGGYVVLKYGRDEDNLGIYNQIGLRNVVTSFEIEMDVADDGVYLINTEEIGYYSGKPNYVDLHTGLLKDGCIIKYPGNMETNDKYFKVNVDAEGNLSTVLVNKEINIIDI